MNKKNNLSPEEFIRTSKEIYTLINEQENFFFYFSPDPDAIGVSVAFALFLKKLQKNCILYLPEGFNKNLDFMFDISKYNNIIVLMDLEEVKKTLGETEHVFVICDTASYHLLPHFKEITEAASTGPVKYAIEVDHHFGGDSKRIFESSLALFITANSTCDVLACFFEALEKHGEKNYDMDFFFPRNIVLSLLVGVCFDTQFGKFVVNKEQYDKWFPFLSGRLKELTWENSSHLRTSEELFASIGKMNEMKEKQLQKVLKNAKVKNGAGVLLLPPVGYYESLASDQDSTFIVSKVVTDLVNLLAERAGSVGILAFYDDTKNIFFLKIRRSTDFKGYDLRSLETVIKQIYGDYFLGGGGHPGATSFRIKQVYRKIFIKLLKNLHQKVAGLLEGIPKEQQS